eukprot:gene3557-4482_t
MGTTVAARPHTAGCTLDERTGSVYVPKCKPNREVSPTRTSLGGINVVGFDTVPGGVDQHYREWLEFMQYKERPLEKPTWKLTNQAPSTDEIRMRSAEAEGTGHLLSLDCLSTGIAPGLEVRKEGAQLEPHAKHGGCRKSAANMKASHGEQEWKLFMKFKQGAPQGQQPWKAPKSPPPKRPASVQARKKNDLANYQSAQSLSSSHSTTQLTDESSSKSAKEIAWEVTPLLFGPDTVPGTPPPLPANLTDAVRWSGAEQRLAEKEEDERRELEEQRKQKHLPSNLLLTAPQSSPMSEAPPGIAEQAMTRDSPVTPAGIESIKPASEAGERDDQLGAGCSGELAEPASCTTPTRWYCTELGSDPVDTSPSTLRKPTACLEHRQQLAQGTKGVKRVPLYFPGFDQTQFREDPTEAARQKRLQASHSPWRASSPGPDQQSALSASAAATANGDIIGMDLTCSPLEPCASRSLFADRSGQAAAADSALESNYDVKTRSCGHAELEWAMWHHRGEKAEACGQHLGPDLMSTGTVPGTFLRHEGIPIEATSDQSGSAAWVLDGDPQCLTEVWDKQVADYKKAAHDDEGNAKIWKIASPPAKKDMCKMRSAEAFATGWCVSLDHGSRGPVPGRDLRSKTRALEVNPAHYGVLKANQQEGTKWKAFNGQCFDRDNVTGYKKAGAWKRFQQATPPRKTSHKNTMGLLHSELIS